MANYIAWEDTQGTKHLDRPFLAYVGKQQTRRFGDWLYGRVTHTNKRHTNLNEMYGTFQPQNLQKIALKSSKSKRAWSQEKDNEIIKYLKNIKKKLLQQERKLYRDLKCGDFFGFKLLWEKGQLSSEVSVDPYTYWLNYHLDLLTGETVRLALEKNYSLIERILALASVELENMKVSGMEEEKIGKKGIKYALEQAGVLQIVEDIVYKQTGRSINVWVPMKEYSGANFADSQFVQVLIDFFSGQMAEEAAQDAYNLIDSTLADNLAKALGTVKVKQKRVKNLMKRTTEKEGRSKNWFTEVNFAFTGGSKADLLALAKEIYNFQTHARTFKLSDEEYERWKTDNKGSALSKKIKKSMEELVIAYFKNRDFFDITKQGLQNNAIQGFLGELAAYGKGYFNLKSTGAKVFDVGSFHNVNKGKLLGVDTVLVVKNTPYGIQVKNPFALINGYYKTYRNDGFTLKESNEKKIIDLFGFTEDEYENFIMYNLNINNTSNPNELITQIEKFLFLYTDNFARLEQEEIAEDLSKYQDDTLSSLQEKSINNVFFILKGEILPSSWIVQGLIEQYNYLNNEASKYHQKNIKNKRVVMNYHNNIKKRYVQDISGDENYDEKKAYDPTFIPSETETNAYLDKIGFNFYLKLEIPSIEELMKNYK